MEIMEIRTRLGHSMTWSQRSKAIGEIEVTVGSYCYLITANKEGSIDVRVQDGTIDLRPYAENLIEIMQRVDGGHSA